MDKQGQNKQELIQDFREVNNELKPVNQT